MNIIKCPKCGEMREHQAKGLCFNCYRKFAWKQKLIICKRCGRERPNQAKGLCVGCYHFVFHLDKAKAWNHRKLYGLSIELYKELTKCCVICSFDKIVDLHHLDQNKENNSESNLVGLCPNHHKMLHDFRFKEEIQKILKEKGYKFSDDLKLIYKSKSNLT
jgi:ribosomal protein L37E